MAGKCHLLLYLLCYLGSVELSLAFNCPNGLYAFPPGSCVSLSPGQRSECDSRTAGLAVLSESQLSPGGILSTYAAAVLDGSQLMWLGYRYSSGVDLIQDGQGLTGMVTNSVLNDNANFDLSTSTNPESGVCVAVNRNGTFVRRQCSDSLQWSLCQRQYVAPNASVSGPSSPVSDGSPVTLTCSTSGTDVTVSWLAAIGSDPPTTLSSTTSNYTINSFSPGTHAGRYFCVATNPLGAYVSTPVQLSSSGTTNPSVAMPTFQTDPAQVVYNAAANFSCSGLGSDTLNRVLWFINGSPVSSSGLVLSVDSVQEQGFYKCVAITSGSLYDGTERVIPTPGVPSVVDVVSVEPMSKSSLSVQWLCPEAVGTHDPILLTYQVTYYSSSSSTPSSSTQSVVSVRAALSMQDKNSCLLRTVLEGLEEGTSYSVKVRAMASSVLGADSGMVSQAATFGQAPGVVPNFEAFRSEDNKTVYAKWDKLVTTPPVGVVVVYDVEYRPYEKKSANSILHTPDQTELTISNVVDAGLYQLRVRAGVHSSIQPVKFNYGPFTEWMTVGDSVIPTGGLTAQPQRTGAIVAGSVVGGLVFTAIVAIIIVGVACFVVKDKGSSTTLSRTRKQSSVGLKDNES